MAEWESSAARKSLRTLLADNDGDKFEFKVPIYPVPDGHTKDFSLGRTRILEGSLTLYLDGAIIQDGDIDNFEVDTGVVSLVTAPPPSGALLASFGYQWFSDEQLDEAVIQGCQTLSFETVPLVSPVGLRPVALDFAAYHAYMMMAAIEAEEIVVTAGGYEAHQYRSHPNWREMARLAFEKAQTKLKVFLETALGQESPALAMTAYRMINYQGR